MHVCVYMYVLVHVCVIYGCHPSDDQRSCRRSIYLKVRPQICRRHNPQAMKCIHKQFTVKSVGSEWPPGVKESVRNTAIPLTLAW